MSQPAETRHSPRVLLLPVSGPGGAGEYFRTLAIARGIERRWPGAAIQMVVSRDAPYVQQAPFPTLLVDRSPTFETAAVNAILERDRPDVAIFDSSGRVAQYETAHRTGARLVFVSSRASTRRKGFRLRRMRWFDQHWIAQPRFLGGELTVAERLKQRMLGGPEVLFLEVLHEPPDASAAAALQLELGIRPKQFVLVCPGGGGVSGNRPDAVPLFHAAAMRIAERCGLPVVAVLGSRHVPNAPAAPGVHVLSGLPNGQLMAMLHDARFAVLNGGSLLLQALAQHTPVVAAPIAEDQPDRIASCVAQGYARGVALSTDALVEAAVELHGDEKELGELHSRLVALDLRNGVDVAVRALSRWWPPPRAGEDARPAVPVSEPVSPRVREPRLRIMHVILSSGFAGSERAAAEACNAMSVAHDVAIVIRSDHRRPGGGSIRDHLHRRVEVVEVPGALFTRSHVAEAVRAWRPDVIHTHLRRGTRFIAQMRPAAVHVASLHLSINGPHYLRTDGLLCVSRWQLSTVPADYKGRVYLIPNSLVPCPRLDSRRVAELRAELGAQAGEYLIGGVGRLAASKGFDVLLRAFEQARLPGSRLVIVGDGRERPRLRRLAGEHVVLAGYRADAKECFQAFDLFVSSSRSEPFGRVIIEALDGGAPVIATEAQGPRDIAQHYPIELVPTGSVAALAAAIRRAHARPHERMAVDLSEFHVDRVVERMLGAYREVIGLRRQREAS